MEEKKPYQFDAHAVKESCVDWTRNWFRENGDGCNAIVGISGGKDSSVVAALCVEALGRDRVFGVMMPNGEQPDIGDSRKLVEHLGIDYICVNIHQAILAIKHEVRPQLHDRWSTQTSVNLPARIRMATLYAVSQSMNGRVANTCNLSEDWVGYSPRYGDSAGDFSPLSKLTTDEVVEIGKLCGLPEDLVCKTPSDGLCGKTDEDNLGFSYRALNEYIRTGNCESLEVKTAIDAKHRKNMFKLKPMPAFDPGIDTPI